MKLFSKLGRYVSLQASSAATVTPSDSTDLTNPSLLYIGVAGALKVTTMEDEDVVFPAVVAGPFPVWVKRVWATGTTASSITALR